MSDFLIYLEIGFKHVLNINGYDHILFLMALTVTLSFKDWKKVLLLVTVFTIGHALSLLLSVMGIIIIQSQLVEFIIPITILITAGIHLFSFKKATKPNGTNLMVLITFFFGTIHGLGFSNYFKSILSGTPAQKIIPSIEFALGIEAAQIVIVLVFLLFSYILQHFFRCSKRDFVLVTSALVIGITLPMLLESSFLK
jgi:HupE / UreJ protein